MIAVPAANGLKESKLENSKTVCKRIIQIRNYNITYQIGQKFEIFGSSSFTKIEVASRTKLGFKPPKNLRKQIKMNRRIWMMDDE